METEYLYPEKVHATAIWKGDMHYKNCIQNFLRTLQRLDQFKKGVFGRLYDLKTFYPSGSLIHGLLLCQVYPQCGGGMTFRIHGRNVNFTLSDFCVLTGLRGTSGRIHYYKDKKNRLLDTYFHSKNPTGDVMSTFMLTQYVDDDGDAIKIAEAYFFYYVILGRRSTNVLDEKFLLILDDPVVSETYSWGSYAFKDTIKSFSDALDRLEVGRTSKQIYNVQGFPLALQVWFFEKFPSLKISLAKRVGKDCPRVLNWEMKRNSQHSTIMSILFHQEDLPNLRILEIRAKGEEAQWISPSKESEEASEEAQQNPQRIKRKRSEMKKLMDDINEVAKHQKIDHASLSDLNTKFDSFYSLIEKIAERVNIDIHVGDSSNGNDEGVNVNTNTEVHDIDVEDVGLDVDDGGGGNENVDMNLHEVETEDHITDDVNCIPDVLTLPKETVAMNAPVEGSKAATIDIVDKNAVVEGLMSETVVAVGSSSTFATPKVHSNVNLDVAYTPRTQQEIEDALRVAAEVSWTPIITPFVDKSSDNRNKNIEVLEDVVQQSSKVVEAESPKILRTRADVDRCLSPSTTNLATSTVHVPQIVYQPRAKRACKPNRRVFGSPWYIQPDVKKSQKLDWHNKFSIRCIFHYIHDARYSLTKFREFFGIEDPDRPVTRRGARQKLVSKSKDIDNDGLPYDMELYGTLVQEKSFFTDMLEKSSIFSTRVMNTLLYYLRKKYVFHSPDHVASCTTTNLDFDELICKAYEEWMSNPSSFSFTKFPALKSAVAGSLDRCTTAWCFVDKVFLPCYLNHARRHYFLLVFDLKCQSLDILDCFQAKGYSIVKKHAEIYSKMLPLLLKSLSFHSHCSYFSQEYSPLKFSWKDCPQHKLTDSGAFILRAVDCLMMTGGIADVFGCDMDEQRLFFARSLWAHGSWKHSSGLATPAYYCFENYGAEGSKSCPKSLDKAL